MPERKHKLPSCYERLDARISGPVIDSIVIDPRSRGRLYLPGGYSTEDRPPLHRVVPLSADSENQGVYTEQRQVGNAERYTVTWDVWNYRDSPAFAELVLDEASGTSASFASTAQSGRSSE